MITGTNFLAFLLRPKRKVGVFIITGIWLLIFAVLFRYYQPLAAFQQVKGDIYDGGVKQSTTAQEKEAYAKIKETIFDSIPIQKYQEKHNISDGRKIEAHSSIYDIIFANHAVNSVLGTLNFEQRCDLYFTTLYTDSNTWYLNPDKELPLVEDNYDYKEYRKRKPKT